MAGCPGDGGIKHLEPMVGSRVVKSLIERVGLSVRSLGRERTHIENN